MDAHSHGHGHGRDAVVHVHATVDRLANDLANGCRMAIVLDADLIRDLGAAADAIVEVATERGRQVLARLDPALPEDAGTGIVRMDRLVRQALKAHLNEEVEIRPAEARPAKRVELTPAVDVSDAHDIVPHLKRLMVEARTPASVSAVLYLPFRDSQAGTTYEIHQVAEGTVVAESTEVILHYADSHLPEGAFDVTFEDVGGLGQQIRLLRELVQLPLKFPHLYRHLGINPPRGILLYGPPGAGKTHMARAVANEVEARFYYINGPDIIGTYTGETEANLRKIFNEAGHHAPSIIFIDEFDAVAPKRGETGAHADIRAVTQLLALMDGLRRVDSVIVIATTNRLDSVDLAFRRPGRFDREIFIGPPDVAGRREVLEIHAREMPLSGDAEQFLDDVARRTHGFVGADLMELCRDAGLSALRRSTAHLPDHRVAFRIPVGTLKVEREDFETALSQVRPSALRETLLSVPDVSWADIGGLEAAKNRLRELVDYQLRNPKSAKLMRRDGVLLYGPPGTGKTLLAKAIAKECGVNFIAVDGPELFTKWLGESEEAMRHVFRIARQVAPTVVFFDQLDAIAPVRGQHSGSMTTDRVVNQLLSELDGVEQSSHVIVIGASNRVDLIDPSMLRPGRFGMRIHVPLPDAVARREILRVQLLANAQFEDAGTLDQIVEALASATDGFSGARLRQVCDEAQWIALRSTGFAQTPTPTLAQALEALEAKRED